MPITPEFFDSQQEMTLGFGDFSRPLLYRLSSESCPQVPPPLLGAVTPPDGVRALLYDDRRSLHVSEKCSSVYRRNGQWRRPTEGNLLCRCVFAPTYSNWLTPASSTVSEESSEALIRLRLWWYVTAVVAQVNELVASTPSLAAYQRLIPVVDRFASQAVAHLAAHAAHAVALQRLQCLVDACWPDSTHQQARFMATAGLAKAFSKLSAVPHPPEALEAASQVGQALAVDLLANSRDSRTALAHMLWKSRALHPSTWSLAPAQQVRLASYADEMELFASPVVVAMPNLLDVTHETTYWNSKNLLWAHKLSLASFLSAALAEAWFHGWRWLPDGTLLAVVSEGFAVGLPAQFQMLGPCDNPSVLAGDDLPPEYVLAVDLAASGASSAASPLELARNILS